MDIGQLPALPHLASLDEAWSILERSQRSALVTEIHAAPVLITARDIVLAENEGKTILEEVTGTPLKPLGTPLADAELPYLLERGVRSPAAGSGDRVTRLVREHVQLHARLGREHQRVASGSPLEAAFERLLEQMSSHELALLDIELGSALILSGHESDQLGLTPPKHCECSNPDYGYRHPVPAGAQTGTSCSVCGWQIICKR